VNTSTSPFVECEQIHAGLAVTDIAAAIDFYTKKLGFKLAFTWGDQPTFAGVSLDKVQMFLRKGTPNPNGCVVYFLVGDADQLYEFHRANDVAIACGTCMGTIFPLGITCSTPARRSRLSEWMCRCGWRSVLPLDCRIWPSMSA